MKILRAFARFIVGVTFIFSGFSKIIDPVGAGLIVGEYFKIVGIESYSHLFQLFGATLSGVELLLGISLLLGLRMKISCTAAMYFISFFTCITFVLAIFNPIKECGCFGEVLKLTNWQTFYKNIFLMSLVLVLFFQRDRFIPIAPEKWENIFVGAFVILIAILPVYSYRHLPLMDFMDYKVGTDISEKLSDSENSGGSNYETVLFYKKDGKVVEFTIDNLPDSTWTFVDSKTKQKSSSNLPSLISFAVSDRDGNYLTDSLLAIKGKLFITSIPYLDKLKPEALSRVKKLNRELAVKGVPHLILTGSSPAMVDALNVKLPDISIYYTDYKTLLTMNRSNGGLIYLNDATVTAKWSISDMPLASIDKILGEDPELLAAKSSISEQLAAEVTAVIILILIAVMRYICKFSYTHKTTENENISES